MKTLAFLFLMCLLTYGVSAQDKASADLPLVSKPLAILNKAVGHYYDHNNAKWNLVDNRIEGLKVIDQFDKYEFHTVIYKDKKYLLLRKNYEICNYVNPLTKEGKTIHKAFVDWAIDLAQYKKAIDSMSVTDNELVLGVEAYNFDLLKVNAKDANATLDKAGERQKLVFRFRLDKEKNTARFIIYAREQLNEDYFKIKYLSNNTYNSYSQEGAVIASSGLYDHFFYETDYASFVSFLKAPLSQ